MDALDLVPAGRSPFPVLVGTIKLCPPCDDPDGVGWARLFVSTGGLVTDFRRDVRVAKGPTIEMRRLDLAGLMTQAGEAGTFHVYG